jgi:hypothetical protein
MAERLRLLAADEADLETISALVQDAAVKSGDVAYDAKARRLVIIANRYRWETRQPSRVRCVLRLDSLTGLKRRSWPSSGTVLDLLALRWENGGIEIDFAGGAALRAEAECIDVELHDLSGPWGAKRTPRHAL